MITIEFGIICALVIIILKLTHSYYISEKAATHWLNEFNRRGREEDTLVKQSVKRSLDTQRSVIKGKIAEEMFPLLMNLFYGYKLADFKFMGGDPIDYIIFEGLSENQIKSIIFVDVKTGNAKLTERQEVIKFIVNSCNSPYIKWITFRIGDDGYVSVE